jgi:cytochrome c oxidase subunit 2
VLKSADVIHSFWVPELAGKTEMIPGLTNQQWLEADKPGTYRGQCTQFCGLQHAHMAFDVIAESPEDFAAWEKAERQPAEVAATTAAGRELFQKNCASCHTVRGTDAAGLHGPDLTHLIARQRLAAGLMPNTPDNLANWVAHPQELKPGVSMPDFAFAPEDASALSAYLATLR